MKTSSVNFNALSPMKSEQRRFSSGLDEKGKKEDVPLRTAYSQAGRCGMQPKAKHSLRAQAQLSETKTETMRTETVETFELVKVEQKLLREEKGERERRAFQTVGIVFSGFNNSQATMGQTTSILSCKLEETGLTEEKVIRQEMVSLLCMNDRTHSQLMDLIPDKCGETSQNRNFESILNQVAVYKAPNFEANGAMMQGTYVPKPEIWEEEYDPIHVLLRAVHRREYQASLDRFSQYLRQNNKLSSSRPPWPPFRIPSAVFDQFPDPRRILHSKTMHGIIFTILYRAVNDPDIPEQILSLCIYLLDMAVRFPASPECNLMSETQDSKEVEDLKYQDWFDSPNILQNISKVVDSVVITEKVVMSMRMVEEMEVDEEVEEDMEMGPDGYTVYDVPSPIIEEDFQDSANQHPQLPATNVQLALPSAAASSAAATTTVATTSSNYTQLVPFPGTPNGLSVMPATQVSSASGSSGSQDSTRQQQLSLTAGSSSYNMALIPTSEGLTTVRPKCMKLKQVPGRHRMLLSDKGLPLAIGSSELDSCSGEQRYHSFSNKRTIDVHESILSLLLQLHSKLSEKPDSYKPKQELSSEELNSRIGDGILFVERLLNQITVLGKSHLSVIQSIRQKLWPRKIDVTASPSSENIDKEERRRRAKERQQKLMAEFASKQKAFMQKTMETELSEMGKIHSEPSTNRGDRVRMKLLA
ncbi:e3 ubiquitin-protein ligase UBR3 [Trichonephila clavipes]|nr:e3 ubiquitin-protein ligase UBR3 [Trichonephila clavipes]